MDVQRIESDSDAMKTLAHLVAIAVSEGRDLSIAFDGGLKVKLGEGMWSPPESLTAPHKCVPECLGRNSHHPRYSDPLRYTRYTD